MDTSEKPGNLAEYLSAQEYAKETGVGRDTVWRWCKKGIIPGAVRLPGEWRIPRGAVPMLDKMQR